MISQSIILPILFSFGLIGNPNLDLKSFLTHKEVEQIISTQKVYLIDINEPTKERTLLEFYLPQWEHFIKPIKELPSYSHVLTTNKALIRMKKRTYNFSYKKVYTFRDLVLIQIENT